MVQNIYWPLKLYALLKLLTSKFVKSNATSSNNNDNKAIVTETKSNKFIGIHHALTGNHIIKITARFPSTKNSSTRKITTPSAVKCLKIFVHQNLNFASKISIL